MRLLYEKLIPYETRYWLYKLRHPQDFKKLRTTVYESEKGNFSLRPYDEKKCIFVHITKSAGTSVAKSLFGALPYHYTATQYRVIFGRAAFNSYFKFAFVRNPWDRLHSAFSYLKKGGWNQQDRDWAEKNLKGMDNVNDFVMNWLSAERLHSHIHFWPQMDFITDRRKNILVDEILYFETIDADYQRLAERIGAVAPLVHVNASKKANYKDIYSNDAIEKVRRLYAQDISALGYAFESFKRMTIKNKKLTPAVD